MASIYKRTQESGKKRSCWYIGYKNHLGQRKTVKGFSDRSATERLAAQLEEDARLVRRGLKAAPEQDGEGAIDQHLNDFRRHLQDRDVSPLQVETVTTRVKRIISGCKFSRPTAIRVTAVDSFLAQLRDEGLSKQTTNHYVRAFRQFCLWLVRTKRLTEDPTVELKMLNVRADLRHERRALSAEEFIRLLEAAEQGFPEVGLTGIDRAAMYLLAASTGYRRGEIGSLKLRAFNFETTPATVTVQAAYSKRRRCDTQVLSSEVADYLGIWLKSKSPRPEELLFPVSAAAGGIDRRTSEMIQRDLAAARSKWLDEAQSADERAQREESDVLVYRDREGRYADFHAMRHTFITNLGRAGVTPKTAQKLARHCDIRLTMNVYSHTDLSEETEAINRLPRMLRSGDGRAALPLSPKEGINQPCPQHLGSAHETQPDTNGQLGALGKSGASFQKDRGLLTQDVVQTEVDAPSHNASQENCSTPGGARTPNPWFRRPVLYPIELRTQRVVF